MKKITSVLLLMVLLTNLSFAKVYVYSGVRDAMTICCTGVKGICAIIVTPNNAEVSIVNNTTTFTSPNADIQLQFPAENINLECSLVSASVSGESTIITYE